MSTFSWEPFGPSRRAEPRPQAAALARPARARAAPSRLGPEPARGLVVLTCMDARVDPLAVLGLRLGDAHVLRNAGAAVTEDVLRSLRSSHQRARTRRLLLLGHSGCVANGSEEETLRVLRRGLAAVQRGGALPEGFAVEAALYDLASGSLTPVT